MALGLLSHVAQQRVNAGGAPHQEPEARPEKLSGDEWEGAWPVVPGSGGMVVWVPAPLANTLLQLLNLRDSSATSTALGRREAPGGVRGCAQSPE